MQKKKQLIINLGNYKNISTKIIYDTLKTLIKDNSKFKKLSTNCYKAFRINFKNKLINKLDL